MRFRRVPLFQVIGALAAWLPLLAGCSLPAMVLGHFEPPVVTLSASRVESISPSVAVVQLVLTAANPNAFALTARAAACHLRVNGDSLEARWSGGRVTVPAHASSPLEIRTEVPFPALSAAAPDALMLGEIPYDLDGTLLVGSFPVTEKVSFSVSGVLRINLLEVADLRRDAAVGLRKPARSDSG